MTRWDIDPGDACLRCGGTGQRIYPNTTTWHGGVGGQALTNDVCDQCWGSGDKTRPGADLRRVYAMYKAMIDKYAFHIDGCAVISPGAVEAPWKSHRDMVLDSRCTCGLRALLDPQPTPQA